MGKLGEEVREAARRWHARRNLDQLLIGVNHPCGRVKADEVHTIIDPNFEDPDNPFEGLSPRQAVANAIGQFYKADIANEASLRNGVEPGGIVKTDQVPSQQQINDAQAKLDEQYSRPVNRKRPLFMWGGMEWQQTG